METLKPSPEVWAEEEKNKWRQEIGTWSWQFLVPRRPQDIADLCTILEELNASLGEGFEKQQIDQIRIIGGELDDEYGKKTASFLTINYESPKEIEINNDLPDVIDTADEVWSREENSLAISAIQQDFELAVEKYRKTMTPEALKYYDETPLGIVEIHLPPHYKSVKELARLSGWEDK